MLFNTAEAILLVFNEIGARFWTHFNWFRVSSVSEDGFDERLEKSLLAACAELLRAKLLVLSQYESICEEPSVQTIFGAPDVQRRFIRTLHFLETLWHLVVLPIPGVILRLPSVEPAIRSGLWRKLLFHFFARQFDLMQPTTGESDDASTSNMENGPSDAFQDLVTQLNALSLLDTCSEVIQALLRDRIQRRMVAETEAVSEESSHHLRQSKAWVEEDCLSFLSRVLVPSLDVSVLKEKLDDLERLHLEKPEDLRASQDSDMEDSFVFEPGLRRVPSTPLRNAQSAYAPKETLSSIKKLQAKPRRLQLEGLEEVSSSEESESSDDEDFLSRQPNFGPASTTSFRIGEGASSSAVSSPIGSQLYYAGGRMSPMRPNSPGGGKVPASPIPISAASSMSEWVLNHSINAITAQREARMRQLCNWRTQLFRFLFETVASVHIRRLFDLIVDYPNSQPALLDLKTCMAVTQQYGELISTLSAAFHKRLLQPGASTSDIVTVFISTIRAIREIDPSNVLLSLVTTDLRRYLRQRPDSLRAIVSLLTEDGGESGISLVSELEESSSIRYGGTDVDLDSEDEEGAGAGKEEWNPAPVIRAPSISSASTQFASSSFGDSYGHGGGGGVADLTRAKDLISMLISIHGSKYSFLSEYANLLASRLLDLSDFSTEVEVKNVELLKLKFGESAMLQCEVMLKDLAESKRINTAIHRSMAEQSLAKTGERKDENEVDMSIAIFSHLFWPSNFQTLTVSLPPPLQAQREQIERSFTSLKSSRTLMWYDAIGTVELELCLAQPEGDGDAEDDVEQKETEVKSFTVTPLQAAIVMQFQEAEELGLAQLATSCKIPPDVAKRGLAPWLSNGVIKEVCTDSYKLAETLDATDEIDYADPNAGDEDEVQIDDEEFIPFIKAMLKQKPLSLAGIHGKLTHFKEEYSLTIQQLSELLDRMVQRELIEMKSGVFALVKA